MSTPLPAGATGSFVERLARSLEITSRLNIVPRVSNQGEVEVRLGQVHAYHLGGIGGRFLNGAVILAMMDATIACAGMHALDGMRLGTAELSTRFLRPIAAEGAVARIRSLRRRGRAVRATAQLFDAEGRVCATAAGMVVALRDQGSPTARKGAQ